MKRSTKLDLERTFSEIIERLERIEKAIDNLDQMDDFKKRAEELEGEKLEYCQTVIDADDWSHNDDDDDYVDEAR